MRNLIRYFLPILGTSVTGIGGGACAEIPDMRPAKMHEIASQIITGKVARIYSSVDRSDASWETTHSVAELQVRKVEKGKHDGKIAYVRFWNKRYTGKGAAPPGFYGHRGVPAVGAVTRAFVVQGEDGGLDVLPPNGFAAVADIQKEK